MPNGQILPPRLDPLCVRAGPNPAGAPAYLSRATITCDDYGWNGAAEAGDISIGKLSLCDLWMFTWVPCSHLSGRDPAGPCKQAWPRNQICAATARRHDDTSIRPALDSCAILDPPLWRSSSTRPPGRLPRSVP